MRSICGMLVWLGVALPLFGRMFDWPNVGVIENHMFVVYDGLWTLDSKGYFLYVSITLLLSAFLVWKGWLAK